MSNVEKANREEESPPDSATGDALARLMRPSLEDLQSMRQATNAQIQAEKKHPLARLRSLKTSSRRALLLGILGAFGAAALSTGAGDLWVIITFLAIAAGSLWMALRPAYEAPPPKWLSWSLPALSLLVVGVVASLAPRGAMPFANHVHCFIPGMGVAVLLLGVTRLLSRGPLGFVPFAGSVGAGVAANGFLAGRCHFDPTLEHVLIGHGSVIVVLLAFAAVARLGIRR